MQEIKFWWWYSYTTWTVSLSMGSSLYWYHMLLGIGCGPNVGLRDFAIFLFYCHREHPCFTNTCLVLSWKIIFLSYYAKFQIWYVILFEIFRMYTFFLDNPRIPGVFPVFSEQSDRRFPSCPRRTLTARWSLYRARTLAWMGKLQSSTWMHKGR